MRLSPRAERANAIAESAKNPELRRALEGRGRKFVERNYSVSAWGPRFAAIASGERRLSSSAA